MYEIEEQPWTNAVVWGPAWTFIAGEALYFSLWDCNQGMLRAFQQIVASFLDVHLANCFFEGKKDAY